MTTRAQTTAEADALIQAATARLRADRERHTARPTKGRLFLLRESQAELRWLCEVYGLPGEDGA